MNSTLELEKLLHDKRHIIWDWNGTLLADLEHNVRIVNRLLESAKLPPVTVERHRSLFGFPVIDYYLELGFQLTPQEYSEISIRFNREYEAGLHECDLAPGMRRLLTDLKQHGKIQSILSASKQSALEAALKQFGVFDIFDHIYGIEDYHASSKLDRGQALMRESVADPVHTVLVGDTDHDLEVGQALGVDVILVDHGHQSYERLIEKHPVVIRSFPQ
jgi:phosphoglycolate phosphatase